MHVDKQIKRIFGTYYQINNGNEYKKGKSFSLELSANFPKYGKVLWDKWTLRLLTGVTTVSILNHIENVI